MYDIYNVLVWVRELYTIFVDNITSDLVEVLFEIRTSILPNGRPHQIKLNWQATDHHDTSRNSAAIWILSNIQSRSIKNIDGLMFSLVTIKKHQITLYQKCKGANVFPGNDVEQQRPRNSPRNRRQKIRLF